MTGLAGAVLAALVAGLLSWGCGRWLACRLLAAPAVAETLAVGLVVLGVLGGLLNLFGLATRPVLIAVLCTGLVAGLACRPWRWLRRPYASDLLVLLPVLLLAGAHAWLVLPAGVFNIIDDQNGYLLRPLRMLASGSVAGGGFDALGVDALGLQAFHHGLVLALAQPSWAPLFDAVLCLLLAALLLDAWARRLGVGPCWRGVAMLALALLPTQSVNLSALYSGTVMTLLALCAATRLQASAALDRGSAFLFGLAAASLLALKLTFAPFAVALCVLVAGARARRRGVSAALGCAGWMVLGGVAAAIPWLGVLLREFGVEALTAGGTPLPGFPGGLVTLRLQGELIWGGRPWHFMALVATLLPALLVCRLPDGAAAARRVLLLAWLALLVATTGAVWLVDLSHAVRFSSPLLAGLVPAGVALLGLAHPAWLGAALVLPVLAVTSVMSTQLQTRLVQAARVGALLSYPVDPLDRERFAALWSADSGEYVRALQARTPRASTLLVMAAFAPHLDFERQPVWTVSDTGLLARWNRLPVGADASALHEHLRARGVDFVLLQLRGFGARVPAYYDMRLGSVAPAVRRVGETGGWLVRGLVELANRQPVLAYDGNVVLFDLRAAPGGTAGEMTDGE